MNLFSKIRSKNKGKFPKGKKNRRIPEKPAGRQGVYSHDLKALPC
jgi:hypothetical protein